MHPTSTTASSIVPAGTAPFCLPRRAGAWPRRRAEVKLALRTGLLRQAVLASAAAIGGTWPKKGTA